MVSARGKRPNNPNPILSRLGLSKEDACGGVLLLVLMVPLWTEFCIIGDMMAVAA